MTADEDSTPKAAEEEGQEQANNAGTTKEEEEEPPGTSKKRQEEENGGDAPASDDVAAPAAKQVKEDLEAKFPSLARYFGRQQQGAGGVDIVGLYFAAGWCPDCSTAVTPAVGQVAAAAAREAREGGDEDVAKAKIVWVGSDRSEKEIVESKPNDSVDHVPYGSAEERAALKRHFGTCASKEREELGMSVDQRKHGLPTLILIDAKTQSILTEDGVDTLLVTDDGGNEMGEKKTPTARSSVAVLKAWKALLSSSNASKTEDDGKDKDEADGNKAE